MRIGFLIRKIPYNNGFLVRKKAPLTSFVYVLVFCNMLDEANRKESLALWKDKVEDWRRLLRDTYCVHMH